MGIIPGRTREIQRSGQYVGGVAEQPTRAERHFQQIERELNHERAALLGRYGRRVEDAIASCATQLDRLEAAGADDHHALDAYRSARTDVLRAVSDLCLQREMLGLTDHSWVERIYTIPPRR